MLPVSQLVETVWLPRRVGRAFRRVRASEQLAIRTNLAELTRRLYYLRKTITAMAMPASTPPVAQPPPSRSVPLSHTVQLAADDAPTPAVVQLAGQGRGADALWGQKAPAGQRVPGSTPPRQ